MICFIFLKWEIINFYWDAFYIPPSFHFLYYEMRTEISSTDNTDKYGRKKKQIDFILAGFR